MAEDPMTAAMFVGRGTGEAGIPVKKAHKKLCVPCQVSGMKDTATGSG